MMALTFRTGGALHVVHNMHSWRYQVEYALEYINRNVTVLLCTGRLSENQQEALRNLSKLHETEDSLVRKHLVAIHSNDDANPFVSLREYFQTSRSLRRRKINSLLCSFHIPTPLKKPTYGPSGILTSLEHCNGLHMKFCSFDIKGNTVNTNENESDQYSRALLALTGISAPHELSVLPALVSTLLDENDSEQLLHHQEQGKKHSQWEIWWPCLQNGSGGGKGFLGNIHHTQFKVYIYPNYGYPVSPQYEQFLEHVKLCATMTSVVEEACLLIPSFDTTPLGPYHDSNPFGNISTILQRLKGLDNWNNGKGHVILDWTDSRCVYADFGEAVIWKSGFDVDSFLARNTDNANFLRPMDVVVPLPPLIQKDSPATWESREILASFRGTPWKGYDLPFLNIEGTLKHLSVDVRSKLKHIAANQSNIIVELEEYLGYANVISFQHRRYASLMENSHFAFICRGDGLHSYRFLEAMQFGAVPVILTDLWVFPFCDTFTSHINDSVFVTMFEKNRKTFSESLPLKLRDRWIGFGLKYSETEIPTMIDDLSRLPNTALREIHTESQHVYDMFVRNYVKSALLLMKHSMRQISNHLFQQSSFHMSI